MSCLSPCCVSKLPGTLEQFEILHFYTDEDLEVCLLPRPPSIVAHGRQT